MRLDDIHRMLLGTFVRPPEETGTGLARVEAVYGYVIVHERGSVVLDTGIGRADAETEQWYQPRRRDLETAVHEAAGIALSDVNLVVNCHLHFDHCGGNATFPGIPILCQRDELAAAREPDYTVADLVDFAGVRYECLDGEAEIFTGVHVIPTPGHTRGHQSIVVECADGTVVLAGQSHDQASGWSADALAAQAAAERADRLLPDFPVWMDRLLAFDPRRVFFAHDAAVWMP